MRTGGTVADDAVSSCEFRVRYGETDQMGVVHHRHYLVWCELARTDHMREAGVSYRELEEQGLKLPVVEACVRYRQPARYDDPIRVRCWVRDVRSRQVSFGYAVERADTGTLLATAHTSLIAVDSRHALTTIPPAIRARLVATPDPVRV
jgi:acyl-CoA thioester hydrolase